MSLIILIIVISFLVILILIRPLLFSLECCVFKAHAPQEVRDTRNQVEDYRELLASESYD